MLHSACRYQHGYDGALQVADMRAAEEELLARVREALGAKHVIRVCSSYDQARKAGAHMVVASCWELMLIPRPLTCGRVGQAQGRI